MAFPIEEKAFLPHLDVVTILFPEPDPIDSACLLLCSCQGCIWLKGLPIERPSTGAVVLSGRDDDMTLAPHSLT